jgi:transposase
MRATHLAARWVILDDGHPETEMADLAVHERPDASDQHSAEDKGGDDYRRVELITGRRRRRDWSPEEKAEILAASMEPGCSVTDVAARYHVSRGLLWTWRRNARVGLARETMPSFVPIQITGDEPSGSRPAVTSEAEPAVTPTGPIEETGPAGSIEIAVGRARVRVQGAVDPEALRQVLALIGPMR